MAQRPASSPLPTRREAMSMCAAGFTVALGLEEAACARPPLESKENPPPSRDEDALDEALTFLHRREPRSKAGLSTHAPMVVEVLSATGHGDRAIPWIEAYPPPEREIPLPSRRIDAASFRSALGPKREAGSWEGALERWGDWKEFFAEELENAPWKDVLDTWTARLAPGICAAALHGVIRTAHATRALARRENKTRLGELARGLAYWAAAYEEMPSRPLTEDARVDSYAEALEKLPLHTEIRGAVPGGNIVSGLRSAASLPAFADALGLVRPKEDINAALSELTKTFADGYLRHGSAGATITKIGFVHAITGPVALRRIAAHVKPETARAALPYAWQAAAGVYCAYATKAAPESSPAPRLDPADIFARALENGHDHAIKLAEAALAENASQPDPVYLAAAEDAALKL